MSLIENAVARLGALPRPPVRNLPPVDSPSAADRAPPASSPAGDKLAAMARKQARAAPADAEGSRSFGPAFELPLARMRDIGFVTPRARATATSQEFRSIKGPVLEKAFGTEAQQVAFGRRIVVTSALPGEGKTFCAINLAMSIAITGEAPVLLIDADVARPAIAELFGIESTAGLIDVLRGDGSAPLGLIRPSDIPGLNVMPAGKSQAHAGELLSSHAMASLLDHLCASLPNWLIIIDSPPLLAITEMRSLVQRVGQVVMVVAAGATPRKIVETALASIGSSQHVSLILNKVPESKMGLDYYYGY